MTTMTLADYVARARDLAPLIREHAERSEREAQLAPEVVDALHDSGLFRIFLPARLGGGDLTIPESLRVFEEAARIDGSTGWVSPSAPAALCSATSSRARPSSRSSAIHARSSAARSIL